MVRDACLYFHSPCFDGIASAVLALDFLEGSKKWTFNELRAVDYDSKERWLTDEHSKPFAIVDFLYHPNAQFWADHHQTAFLSPSLKRNFEKEKHPYHIYNSRSGSCAMLLSRTFTRSFNYQNDRYAELVKWAHKIDRADYKSVEEAIIGDHPALNINRTLAISNDPDYSAWLVRRLRKGSLSDVGGLREVVEKSNEAQRLIKAGLDRLKKAVRLNAAKIAIFNIESSDVLVNRYAPYYFFPEARYSLGMVRSQDGIKITAMRNPWRDFPSIYLGKVFERFGGGGHRRVGALMLRDSDVGDAERVMKRLLQEIRKEESTNKKSVAA